MLNKVIDLIQADFAKHPSAEGITVTLGDSIDRGPDSRGVIERLCSNPFPMDFVALKGNHEDIFLQFLEDPFVGEHWRRLGGMETTFSYGVSGLDLLRGRKYQETAEALRAAIPPAHFDFFNSLKTSHEEDDFFFCHAGVRPGVALDQQDPHDLIWIRNEFLSSGADFGKLVVHGHTPCEEPEIFPNRINIDTGAYASGHLTCLVLPDRTFLST